VREFGENWGEQICMIVEQKNKVIVYLLHIHGVPILILILSTLSENFHDLLHTLQVR
jgi:hypothetical protein